MNLNNCKTCGIGKTRIDREEIELRWESVIIEGLVYVQCPECLRAYHQFYGESGNLKLKEVKRFLINFKKN